MIMPNWLLCRWVSGLPNLAVDLCKTLVVQSLSFALYEAVISHGLSSHLYLVLFYCWLFPRVAGGDSEFKWISCRILSAFCSSAAASSNSYVSLIQTQGGGRGGSCWALCTHLDWNTCPLKFSLRYIEMTKERVATLCANLRSTKRPPAFFATGLPARLQDCCCQTTKVRVTSFGSNCGNWGVVRNGDIDCSCLVWPWRH